MLPGSPHLAEASIYYLRGGSGSSQPPPSSQNFLQHWSSWQSCYPVSPLHLRFCFQIHCLLVLLPLFQDVLYVCPALEPHLSLGCQALNLLEGKTPLPLLGNSYQECRSPCYRLFEAHPLFHLEHFLQSAGCLGENWQHFPQYLKQWDKCWAYYHL